MPLIQTSKVSISSHHTLMNFLLIELFAQLDTCGYEPKLPQKKISNSTLHNFMENFPIHFPVLSPFSRYPRHIFTIPISFFSPLTFSTSVPRFPKSKPLTKQNRTLPTRNQPPQKSFFLKNSRMKNTKDISPANGKWQIGK